MMSRRPNNNIGEASSLLSSRAGSTRQRQPSTSLGRSGSTTGAGGGPSITSYANSQSRRANSQQNNTNNTTSARPRSGAPPQPTPRSRNSTPNNNNSSRVSGLNRSTNSNATGGGRHLQGPPSGRTNNNSASSNYIMQQQRAPPHVEGQQIDVFPKDLAERHNGDFKTSEARASLRLTVENERQLQELVKARRDRSLEVLAMYKDESHSWQSKIDQLKAKLQREENRRIDLASQARDVETEALNLRHQLRQTQAQARKRGEISSRNNNNNRDGGDIDKPVSIIKQVLQRFNNQSQKVNNSNNNDSSYFGDYDDEDGYDSGDDAVYAAILGKDTSAADDDNNNSSWFSNSSTNNGTKKKKQKLTKHERIKAAGKIADELEKSLRTTRLSLESRAAELEASLSEITSLENQKIGFGVTVDDMRERVRNVHNAVKQASWMRSCLPLLEQTVRQREGLAEQGEEYGKKVIDTLMQLNKRDNENCVVLQEKAERNLFKPDDVIRMVQEENQHMSKELGEAVRDAETWRAQMNATSEKYQHQLSDTEKAIDEASKQRQSSTF